MFRISRRLLVIAFLTVLAIPTHAVAQTIPRYTLIDLGTLGGPNSYLDLPGQTMNAARTVIFDPDTSTPDPYAPNCVNSDCFVSHGGEWRHGTLTMLNSLAGGSTNVPFSINDAGLIAGFSQIAVLDPLTGLPEARAVLWQDGIIQNLGTLPGGDESNAFVVNNSGLVAGPASNAIPDPHSGQFFIGWNTETRAVVWQNGVIHDIGTLGGPDALPSTTASSNSSRSCSVWHPSYLACKVPESRKTRGRGERVIDRAKTGPSNQRQADWYGGLT